MIHSPVPLADEAWARGPDPRAQASPTKGTGDSGDENAYDEATYDGLGTKKSLCKGNFQSGSLNEEKTNVGIKRIK